MQEKAEPEEPEEPPSNYQIVELPDVMIKGSTEKNEYTIGEPVSLQGPMRGNAQTASAETAEASNVIRLQSRSFIPDYENKVQRELKENPTGTERTHVLMQCSPESKGSLKERGIEFLSYVQGNTWVASMPTEMIQKMESESSPETQAIKWVGGIEAADKMSRLVKERRTGPWNTAEEGTGLVVRFHNDVPLDEGLALIGSYNGEVTGTARTINAASVNTESLESFLKIAEDDSVAWIEFQRPMSELNYNARRVSGVDTAQGCWTQFTGHDIVAGIYDAGTICTHLDFGDRLTIGDGETRECHYHATHVAGTVAGSGLNTEQWIDECQGEFDRCTSSCEIYCWDDTCKEECTERCDEILPHCNVTEPTQFRGMLPDAQIISYSYSGCGTYCLYNTPGDIEGDYDKLISTYGAHFITNSIGSNAAYNGDPCDINGSADTTSVLLDTIVAGKLGRQIPILYAAGNERGAERCGILYDTLGAPAAGLKNGIVVGATDADDAVTYFTSFGPADDGRIGVTVCMHGNSVISTSPDGSYDILSGTSMATPATAGIVGLLTQAYSEVHNNLPSPSLIKAILTNGADDVAADGIDYQCGFGRANANSSLQHITEGRHMDGSLKEGEKRHTFTLDKESDIKATIAWTDYPGDPMAAKQLVNDLDMELVTPSGEVRYPKHLNPLLPDNPATDERADHTNNIEQIHVTNAEPGLYTLVVKAYELPMGQQTFSIAYTSLRPVEEAALVNNSDENFEGYLNIDVSNINSCGEAVWNKLETIVDDKELNRTRYLPANSSLPLYEIWAGNGGYTPTMPGDYRIHAEFRDSEGNVHKTANGPMKADFYFKVEDDE